MTRYFAAVPLLFLLVGMKTALAGERSSGNAIFDATGCRACHRIGPVGGNSGPDLTLVGFRRSRDWLDQWLKDPHAWKKDTLMPNFRLAAKTREVLVDYLSSLNGEDFRKSAPPWEAPELRSQETARGHVLYVRAGCIACHGVRGAGGHSNNNVPGNMIPAIDKVSDAYTQDELVAKIRHGSTPAKADRSEPAPLVSMPAWGEVLRDDEIHDAASYLLSLGRRQGQGSDW